MSSKNINQNSEFQKIPEKRDKLIQLLTSLINQGLNHQNQQQIWATCDPPGQGIKPRPGSGGNLTTAHMKYSYLVSRLAIISLTSLILFKLSLTLLISVLFPRAVLMGVIFLTFTMFIPCGLFKKLSISSKAFSAPSEDWNLSIGCNAKRSTPVLHHLLTWYGKDIVKAKLPKAPSQRVKSWHLISGWDWGSALGIKN